MEPFFNYNIRIVALHSKKKKMSWDWINKYIHLDLDSISVWSLKNYFPSVLPLDNCHGIVTIISLSLLLLLFLRATISVLLLFFFLFIAFKFLIFIVPCSLVPPFVAISWYILSCEVLAIKPPNIISFTLSLLKDWEFYYNWECFLFHISFTFYIPEGTKIKILLSLCLNRGRKFRHVRPD